MESVLSRSHHRHRDNDRLSVGILVRKTKPEQVVLQDETASEIVEFASRSATKQFFFLWTEQLASY